MAKELRSLQEDDMLQVMGAIHVNHEKRAPGWLGYIGDYTTQLFRDYNKPL